MTMYLMVATVMFFGIMLVNHSADWYEHGKISLGEGILLSSVWPIVLMVFFMIGSIAGVLLLIEGTAGAKWYEGS